MIQISVDKINEMLAEHGMSLADNPELAAQIANLNEQLAATPGFTKEVLLQFGEAFLGHDMISP